MKISRANHVSVGVTGIPGSMVLTDRNTTLKDLPPEEKRG
jgi:hypothetical protein